MPTIKFVKINHGEISKKYQGDMLSTETNCGIIFKNSTIITAQSKQGDYGLLHTTNLKIQVKVKAKSSDDPTNNTEDLTNNSEGLKNSSKDLTNNSEDLNNWLEQLKEVLGDEITFHLIDPHQNQPEHYRDDLEKLCLKHKITPTIYFFKNTKQDQVIMIDNEAIHIKEVESSKNTETPAPSLEPSLSKKVNSKKTAATLVTSPELNQKDFIQKINLQLQTVINELEVTIIKNNKNSKLIDKVARKKKQ